MTTNSAWTSFSATFVDAENVPNFYLASPCFRMHKASCHRQSSAALAHSIGFVYNMSARPWISHHFHNTSTHNHLHFFRLWHWFYSEHILIFLVIVSSLHVSIPPSSSSYCFLVCLSWFCIAKQNDQYQPMSCRFFLSLTQLLTTTTPLCLGIYHCRVDVLQR